MFKNESLSNKSNSKKDTNIVQSVDRAITLLKLIAESDSAIHPVELSERTGLNRTTVWRLLSTLEYHDFVEQNPITKGYQIGLSATRLSAPEYYYAPLIRRTERYLIQLNQETGETIALSVPKALSTLTIYQIDAKHSVRLADYVNVSLPLHCTSNGKLLLSELEKNELEIILERPLKRYTTYTITDKEKLTKEIEQARKNGFACTLGELDENENGISVPILSAEKKHIAYISVGGPDFRFPKEIMLDLAPTLIEISQEISTELASYSIK